MASPVVEGQATYASSSNATSHTINLPSGIQSGELLLLVVSNDGNNDQPSTPSGRTELYSETGTGVAFGASCFYKVATGSEGSTLGLTTPSAEYIATICYRISGVDTSDTPEFAISNTTTSTPNPPNLNTTFSTDVLYFAVCHCDGYVTISYPSGYSGGTTVSGLSGNTAVGNIASAYKQSVSSSEDPGVYNLGGSFESWVTTIGIPSVADAANTTNFFFMI